MGVLHYQKALLEQVGIGKAPAHIRRTSGGSHRHDQGGRAETATVWAISAGRVRRSSIASARSCARNGGDFYNPKTWEIYINQPPAVEALEYWGDLMTKYHAVVPDSITWEFDEIIAGGQNDRYAMTVTLTPYGTLINDPQKSRTGGKWAWAPMPGANIARPEPHLLRRLEPRRRRRRQAQGVGVRVHPDGVQQANGCAARCCAATRRLGCRC